MKIEKFKFNPEAIGKANYVRSEKAPSIIEGKLQLVISLIKTRKV